jgi:hypothetical protein
MKYIMKHKYLIIIAAALSIALTAAFGGITISTDCDAIKGGVALDWRRINSDAELETCLTELTEVMGTPQAMADWLEMQGFEVVQPYDGVEPVSSMVGAYWKPSNNSSVSPYGTAVSRVWEEVVGFIGSVFPLITPAKSYLITISYYENGSIEVDAGPLYL